MATTSLGLAVADPRPANRDRTNNGLHPALRQVAVADNTVAATIVRELGMFGNEGRDLHLHGVGQQPSSIRVQCRRQGLFG